MKRSIACLNGKQDYGGTERLERQKAGYTFSRSLWMPTAHCSDLWIS